MKGSISCKDCKERYVGCHSECESYKEFKRQTAELREKMRKHSEFEYLMHNGGRKK